MNKILITLFMTIFLFSNVYSVETELDELKGTWTYGYYQNCLNGNDEMLIYSDNDYHTINSQGDGRAFWHFLNPLRINIKNENITIETNMVGFDFTILKIVRNENQFIIDAKENNVSKKEKIIININYRNEYIDIKINDDLFLNYNDLIKINNDDLLNKISGIQQSVLNSFGNYIVTTDTLLLRESDDAKAKIIKKLKKNEIIYLWGLGKKDKINNILGQWYYIITEDKIHGYCFNGYLKKITTKE